MQSPAQEEIAMAQAPNVQLNVTTGPAAGKELELKLGRTLIGRRRGDILIADPEISGTHALIEVGADGRVTMTDLDSTNGSYVNGKRVTNTALNDGDRITVGQSKMSISIQVVELASPTTLPSAGTEELVPPTSSGPVPPAVPEGRTSSQQAMPKDFDAEGIGALISQELEGFAEQTDSLIMDLARADEELKLPFRTNLYLEFIEGDQNGQRIQFSKGNVVIGRLNSDVVVKDSDVSRRHALIEAYTRDKIFIKDLGSTNGTYVNGQKITYEKLKHGDQVRVGRTTLSFVVEELQ